MRAPRQASQGRGHATRAARCAPGLSQASHLLASARIWARGLIGPNQPPLHPPTPPDATASAASRPAAASLPSRLASPRAPPCASAPISASSPRSASRRTPSTAARWLPTGTTACERPGQQTWSPSGARTQAACGWRSPPDARPVGAARGRQGRLRPAQLPLDAQSAGPCARRHKCGRPHASVSPWSLPFPSFCAQHQGPPHAGRRRAAHRHGVTGAAHWRPSPHLQGIGAGTAPARAPHAPSPPTRPRVCARLRP